MKALVFAAVMAAVFGAASGRAAECGTGAEGFDDWLKSFKQVAINKGVRRPDLKRLPWSETDFRDAHADPHEAGEPGPA